MLHGRKEERGMERQGGIGEGAKFLCNPHKVEGTWRKSNSHLAMTVFSPFLFTHYLVIHCTW